MVNEAHTATRANEGGRHQVTAEATRTAAELNPKHFELLRLAKLRGLTARKMGEAVYAVPSHTRKADGIEWVVTFSDIYGVTCSCPASKLPYCTHRAAVVDRYFVDEAPVGEFGAYRKADIQDRYELRLRIRSGETTRNDRVYLRYCVKLYEAKRAAVKPVEGIRRVETRLPGGRVKVREYVGAVQI